ncbi:membrane integrity-associated transporter subunit PqiC [Pseudomonas sp. ABC1]|uniref:PqiC family protein n=1 Tax=Pseudomonas sp. ABC1 TaxID=2748080 RepID=UPI0015C37D59|nr:ABC-type transport auxiliary lipoprotein family protein [Pseudomonas sp. ABC1]QLF93073.1 membrane integrity-associated transporter subunit PqiC [Pseudomonas sp. ABC1]
MKVKDLLRFPGLALLAGLLSLGGCATPPPVAFYSLDNGAPSVPAQVGDVAVLLGPVTLAGYLQRDTLLQRQPDGSLAEAPGKARWATGLQQDVEQLLLRQLAWRLNSQRLVLAPADQGFVPDVQVELSITRLDSGPAQLAVLEAQWRLLDKNGKHLGSRLVALDERHQGDVADQVRAQSVLLQRLSAQLGEAIREVRQATTKAPVIQRPRTQPRVEAAPSRRPAEPIRTDMEVFRF